MGKKKFSSKHLKKGCFYLHNDKKGGHPAFLYKKRDQKNLYFVVIFTSSPGKRRTRLKHSLEPHRVKTSFVHNSPIIAKRNSLGKKELNRLKINKEDKPLIKLIEKKK